MHPISGRRWKILQPASIAGVGEVNVPRRELNAEPGFQLQRCSKRPRSFAGCINIIFCAAVSPRLTGSVVGELRRRLGIFHRDPNDIEPQAGIRQPVDYILLNFGGPPKTRPSSRVDQHDESHMTGVAIEIGMQRL